LRMEKKLKIVLPQRTQRAQRETLNISLLHWLYRVGTKSAAQPTKNTNKKAFLSALCVLRGKKCFSLCGH